MSARWPTLLGIALALAWATPVPADLLPPGQSPAVTNPPSSTVSSSSGGRSNPGGFPNSWFSSPGGSSGFSNPAAIPIQRNACGALGGATLSILLTVGGCWVVRNRHRRSD